MNDLTDLLDVGSKKPMGYLPMRYIEGEDHVIAGEVTYALKDKLEARGLRAAIYGPRRMSAPGQKFSGASGASSDQLYVWDRAALQKLIDRNRELLNVAEWPTQADEFAHQVATVLADRNDNPELHCLVGQAFNDSRFRSNVVIETKLRQLIRMLLIH